LQQNRLIPLKTFFEIDNYSLHRDGNHSRSVFYAQAWALIHYLTQANKGANAGNMNKFLDLVMNKVEPEKAFQQTFQSDYATMEKSLKKYVEQRTFVGTVVTLAQKLSFDAEITAMPLSEAEANAYLGDLLYHTREYDDAETYLQKALALDAASSLANTSLGLVRMRQRKFDDAKKYLERSIAADAQNHYAHYNYAYVLSREGMDEFGYVTKFSAESMNKMRDSLKKAIALNPDFTESYHLLGFINLVNNENLEESLTLLTKALQLQPGNQEYAFVIAQIYLKQEKFADAKSLAEKLVKTSDEASLRSNAQNLLDSIGQYEEQKARYQKQVDDLEDRGIRLVRNDGEKSLSKDELAKIKEENAINDLNRELEKPKPDEKRIVGRVEKVACVKGDVNYTVRTETEIVLLSSKGFSGLALTDLNDETESMEFGCGAAVQNLLSVITYRPTDDAKTQSKGTLLAIAFVPKFFRLRTEQEMAQAKQLIVVESEPALAQSQEDPSRRADFEARRREAMMRGVRENLRQPLPGEKRELGVVEKIECGGGGMIFVVKTETRALKLKAKSPQDVKLVVFTPDAAGRRFGCGVKPPPFPAVITYRPNDKQGGEIVALEFVPQSFRLE
jgi:tetratricopeptide (TPR) repeat protein